MLQTVKEYIKENQLLHRNDHVFVGCSGGADSMCLLHMLQELTEEYTLSLTAVHINHMIRGEEALRDQKFVEEYCKKNGIECVVKCADVIKTAAEKHLSLEETGRLIRYETFYKLADSCEQGVIAIAHHGDDLCETMMWNLMRGTGLRGLRGIVSKQGKIIRPLLCLSAVQIRSWMKGNDYAWVDDSTNFELEYTRNQIRNRLFPLMDEISPGFLDRMKATAAELEAADRYFEERAQEFLSDNDGKIILEKFNAVHRVLKPYVIKAALKQSGAGLKDVGRVHYKQIIELSEKGVGKHLILPGGVRVCVGYYQLTFENNMPEQKNKTNCTMECTVYPVKKQQKIIEKMYTKCFDYDKIETGICLRYRENGDRLSVLPGKEKKIKDFFIDKKIPREERDMIPLVADGKHILWVVGYRMGEEYKITENTKTVLQIKIKGVQEDG